LHGIWFEKGCVLSPLFFNFALDYAIWRVQVNQDGLKLNCTHQFLVYVADIIILSGRVCSIMKNKDAILDASKEVSADKIKYMVMSRDQNAGRNHNIKFLMQYIPMCF
jgi:hypothetical protein